MKCLLPPGADVITLSGAADPVFRVVSGKVKSPAIVRGGMSSTDKPGTSDKPDRGPERKVDPWSLTGYLLAGMAVYGGLGWLVDRWVGTENVFTPIGVVFGLAAALYLTFRQLSVLERQEREALLRRRAALDLVEDSTRNATGHDAGTHQTQHDA
jgi:F0F1-type ATP synthase assembly protein I